MTGRCFGRMAGPLPTPSTTNRLCPLQSTGTDLWRVGPRASSLMSVCASVGRAAGPSEGPSVGVAPASVRISGASSGPSPHPPSPRVPGSGHGRGGLREQTARVLVRPAAAVARHGRPAVHPRRPLRAEPRLDGPAGAQQPGHAAAPEVLLPLPHASGGGGAVQGRCSPPPPPPPPAGMY